MDGGVDVVDALFLFSSSVSSVGERGAQCGAASPQVSARRKTTASTKKKMKARAEPDVSKNNNEIIRKEHG